jgi:uncharacterized protein YcfJ
MSISSRKIVVSLVAAAVSAASAGAFAQDRYDDRPYQQGPYEQGPHDSRYDNGDDAYDYARVVDVQPLVTRVRVSTPQRECWDETRVDSWIWKQSLPRTAGGAVLGGIVGAVSAPDWARAWTRRRDYGRCGGPPRVGSQAQRRAACVGAPRYTVQRCGRAITIRWRSGNIRVTYGRPPQVTEMPHRPVIASASGLT